MCAPMCGLHSNSPFCYFLDAFLSFYINIILLRDILYLYFSLLFISCSSFIHRYSSPLPSPILPSLLAFVLLSLLSSSLSFPLPSPPFFCVLPCTTGSYPHAQQFYYAVDRGVGNTLTYDAPANLPDYSGTLNLDSCSPLMIQYCDALTSDCTVRHFLDVVPASSMPLSLLR